MSRVPWPHAWPHRVVAPLLFAVIATSIQVTPSRAQAPSIGAQGLVTDFLGDAGRDWGVGLGFNLTGIVPVSEALDVRADWGARWNDGEGRRLGAVPTSPDWGGRSGERTRDLRVMPLTLDVAYRLEGWSQGRYWVPFVAAGLGFYGLDAKFRGQGDDERRHNQWKSGWNVRAGVHLHRTSGLFLMAETAIHVIDTPQQWTSLYDFSFGIGTVLPAR